LGSGEGLRDFTLIMSMLMRGVTEGRGKVGEGFGGGMIGGHVGVEWVEGGPTT
jgi:hypothetical protein